MSSPGRPVLPGLPPTPRLLPRDPDLPEFLPMPIRRFRRLAAPALLAALATAIVPRPSGADERSPDPAHTTIVTGRLLDADGKPVGGGQVVVMAEHWARFERPLGVGSHNDLPITFRTTGPVRDRQVDVRADPERTTCRSRSGPPGRCAPTSRAASGSRRRSARRGRRGTSCSTRPPR